MAERLVDILKQRHAFAEWRGRNTADAATPFTARATAPLREGHAPPARPLMFKIFSKPTAEVFAAGESLMFRADEAGSQEVNVYAIDANAGASSKRVRLVAE